MVQKKLDNKKGFITLVSVIILAATAGIVGAGALLISTDSANANKIVLNSKIATYSAEACIEQALELIRVTPTYTGGGSLVVGGVTCNYVVSNLVDLINKQVTTNAVVDGVTKEFVITTSAINPQIVINSWTEI